MTEVMLIPQLAYLLGSKVGIFPIVRTFDFSQVSLNVSVPV